VLDARSAFNHDINSPVLVCLAGYFDAEEAVWNAISQHPMDSCLSLFQLLKRVVGGH
jgi:hypothetical protein